MRTVIPKTLLIALASAALGLLAAPGEALARNPNGCGSPTVYDRTIGGQGSTFGVLEAASAGGYDGGSFGDGYGGQGQGYGGHGHGGNGHGGHGGPSVDCPTPDEIDQSLHQVSQDRIKNLITYNRLASVLLGATEQINCGDCGRGFGMAGSFSAGFNGRKKLTEQLSVLGGLSYNEFDSKSAETTRAPIFALGLRYDFTDWGSSRPFFEIAGSLSTGERVSTTRVVNVGGAPGVLNGSTDARTWSLNARAGWVYRVSPVAELAAYVAYARTEQRFGAYTEQGDPTLLPLSYGARNASINVVKGVIQHTQLLSPAVEAHISAAVAHGFGAEAGLQAVTALPFYGAFTPAAKDSTWGEVDARLGFRIAKGTVVDVFALTTFGPPPVGGTIHGGLGLRYLF